MLRYAEKKKLKLTNWRHPYFSHFCWMVWGAGKFVVKTARVKCTLSVQFGAFFLTRACLTRSSWARPISTRCQFGARQFGAFSQFGACQFDARPFDAFYNGNRQHAAGTEDDRKRDGGTT